MGLFYANLAVYPPPRAALLGTLRRLGRPAFLGPTLGGHTVVFDRDYDAWDFAAIEHVAREVTGALACSALAALLHDDDVLYLWLFRDGEHLDWYESLPGYFEADVEPGPPVGGCGRLYGEAFGRPRRHRRRIDELLRANILDDELPEIPGELERHRALAAALGMPPHAAGLGHSAIAGGYVPEEFAATEFEPVPS